MLLANLLLALVWVGLIGKFTFLQFIFGFVLGYLLLSFTPWGGPGQHRGGHGKGYTTLAPRAVWFCVSFLWELIKANLRVLWEVVTPGFQMRAGIVAIELDLESDGEITLLANMITLTPGTLTLDVSADGKTIYIHNMYVGKGPEDTRREIKQGFERKILELTR